MRGADTVPVRGAMVTAHAISARAQGPIDSLRSDAAGRFRFVVARPESAVVYVVSARHAGIGYFSEPFGPAAREGSGAITLTVHDTASGGAPLAIGTRHVVITGADGDGGRRVLDVVEVVNGGTTTRVGADSLAATWRMRLPEDATSPELGESEIAASAVRFADGEVLVSAPIAPGQRQIAFLYSLPRGARRFEVPVDQPTADFEVLAEDSLTAAAAVVEQVDPLVLEGRVFRRFRAANLAAGARPAVTLTRGGGTGTAGLWWIPVAAVGLLLVGGAVYAVRVAPR